MNDQIVIACQKWQEGYITRQEWVWLMLHALEVVTDEDLAGFASVITQYAIHLRDAH